MIITFRMIRECSDMTELCKVHDYVFDRYMRSVALERPSDSEYYWDLSNRCMDRLTYLDEVTNV